MPIRNVVLRLPAQSGTALEIRAGDALEILDIEGEQVADVAIFSATDARERFSPGRTLDYNGSLYLTTGALLYSNRSTPLMGIEADDVGRHDYLLTPCSARMFEILRNCADHPSCHSNLRAVLGRYGISGDEIDATFNVFMNVLVDLNGRIQILPPRSKAGDRILLRALVDVVVGLTACSSEHSNNGRCKPIGYRITSNPASTSRTSVRDM